jgi:hypothetical protein
MARQESLVVAVAVAESELLLEAPALPVVILPVVILPASSGSYRLLACWLALRRPASWQCLQRPPLPRHRSPWFSSASWACRHLQPPLASAWSSPCSPRRWLRGSRRRSCPESARAESRRPRRRRSASWNSCVPRSVPSARSRTSKRCEHMQLSRRSHLPKSLIQPRVSTRSWPLARRSPSRTAVAEERARQPAYRANADLRHL